MRVRLLYFARLREALGAEREDATLPAGVDDVAALTAWLRTRGGAWASELAPGRAVTVCLPALMICGSTWSS